VFVTMHERLEGNRVVRDPETPQQFLVRRPNTVVQRLDRGTASGRGLGPDSGVGIVQFHRYYAAAAGKVRRENRKPKPA